MPGAGRLHLLPTDVLDGPSTTAEAEADVIARAQRDPHAFAPLYERFADPVYRYCYRRLDNSEDAADAASLVFAKALVALPSFRGGSFRAWLFAIAHHVVTDSYRGRGSVASLATAALLSDPAPDPEQVAILTEQRDDMRALLSHLTEDQRRVVELRLGGLTGAEIAEATGCSLSAVKSSQFRAFAQLRRLLRAEPRQEGDRDAI